MGADITYRHIDSLKYEFTIKTYRDCRGIPASAITTTIRCNNASSKAISRKPVRVSIDDVTNICDLAKPPCTPENTRAGKGVEEHVFKDTIDFSLTAFKKLLNCSPNGEVIYDDIEKVLFATD